MSVNSEKSFDVRKEGIGIRDDDGNVILYLCSGTGDPVGTPAPVNTWYFRIDTQILYYKFGVSDTNWRQARAADFTYDPSTANGIVDVSIQNAITSLANRHYGKDAVDNSTEFNDSTTGSAFKIYDQINFNVTDLDEVNKYRMNTSFSYGHNSASNDIRVQLVLDLGTPNEFIFPEIREEAKDAGADQRYGRSILGYSQNLTEGSHTLTLQYRPATASRVSRMYNSVLEVWRVK